MYAAAGTLRAVGFDPTRLSVIGNPVPVLDHVLTKPVGLADFSVSQTGSLVYASGELQAAGVRLAWVDRQGHEESIAAPARAYVQPRVSPDGQRVALDTRDQQLDIWLWDFRRAILTNLTTHPSQDFYPVWSPDGQRIAFASQRAGTFNLFWQPADGTGAAERLTTSSNVQYPYAFTPDGKSLLLRETDPKTASDVSIVSLDGDRRVRPLLHTPFSESNAELSADGRWIAYQSNESGQDEIHVRPFPGVDAGHWQVSTEGGSRPAWARNGRELFYVDGRGRLIGVPVQPGPTFTTANSSVVLESAGLGGITPGRHYDVSLDGRRFLVIRPPRPTETRTPATELNIVLNWGEELKRLAPLKR